MGKASTRSSIKLLVYSSALVAIGALGFYFGKPYWPEQTYSPTPLTSFSAPFVYGQFTIPTDNPLSVEAVALGRRLFYDVRLSANQTVSCATCHKQALAFTDGLTTSVGISGQPLKFNSMSLANMLWGPQRFFWNGRSISLEDQALQPIQDPHEMGQSLSAMVSSLSQDKKYRIMFARAYGEISPGNVARALASFQRTLVSANSKYDKYLRGELSLNEEEELGRKLFMAHPDTKASLRGGNCIDCHSQFLTSGFTKDFDGFSNNGLDDDASLLPGLAEVTGQKEHTGMFKTPTLRNIAVTAPYMHDGRFATLEEVLEHYNRGIKASSTLSALIIEASNRDMGDTNKHDLISLHLTGEEQKAIIAFLHTLTDESFLSNPAFSDPFIEEQKK